MKLKEVDAELDIWAVTRRDRLLALGWPAQSNLGRVIELGPNAQPSGYGNPTEATLLNRRTRDFAYSETAVWQLPDWAQAVIVATYIKRGPNHKRLTQDDAAKEYGESERTYRRHLKEAKERFSSVRDGLIKPHVGESEAA